MKDAVFLACSLGSWVLFGYKYRALLHAPPERKRLILPVLGSSSTAALGFLCITPVVGVNLDRLVGIPNLSVLGVAVFSVMLVCALRVMILNWRHPLERARRTTRWTVFFYGLVIAIMITLFALAPATEEHHHDFVPVLATVDYLGEFLVLFLCVYTGSMINIAYLCLRWASDTPANQPWLRRGLRLISVGILFPIAYGVVSLTAIVGTWFGADLYYWGVMAPDITGAGVPLSLVGLTIAMWGPRLPAARHWVVQRKADLMDYWQLRPLWRTLKPVDPAMVHAPGSLRERFSPGSRLFFRIIEINDWLHQLRGYHDPRVAEILARRGGDPDLAIGDMLAAREAAHIKAALVARTHGKAAADTAASDQYDTPGETSHAFASERARLVLTARALTSPLVDDVLRNSTERGAGQERRMSRSVLSTGCQPAQGAGAHRKDADMPTGRTTHGLVLGGGLAGMLAALVLTRHVDAVTIVERDRLPDGPGDRKGVPHARHVHLLVAGGARALDELLPGTTDTLIASGAHRLGVPNQFVASTPQGWTRRFDETHYIISCSRGLVDWVVREQVLRDERIEVVQAADVIGLSGDPERITGGRLRHRETATTRHIDADFVVDATGYNSGAARWLTELGLPAVSEDRIDPGIFYASRIYRAPADAPQGFPLIAIYSDPRSTSGLRGGVLTPIEDGRWLVTVAGVQDGTSMTGERGFTEFVRNLRHPIIADLIGAAQPLTRPYGFRLPGNHRRNYERLTPWPDGFVVLGDATCVFNPVYGQGMSVVARGALALRDGLRQYGLRHDASRIQHAIARTTDTAWNLATAQDLRYPTTQGPRRGRTAKLQDLFMDRLTSAATGRPHVTAAWLGVLTLSAPPRRLMAPGVVLGAIRGPGRPRLNDPPLTAQELRVITNPST
ncbi:MAB_1171c family putative transporter [Actinophytocola sp.]|uniref:MAB_1171c family putative transporter n=1 Tax=Actinophytocola sp. TaxID=1872138 RepID=UPI003D6B6DF4